ncbi:hypothetical protein, partial [Peptoniphilus sp. BV3C26]|uniref:hypothetical protein n=1 Tax=Peptoniphilus sp. BV3C26 TaxID=1111134 RepID=UPI001EE2E4DE
VSKKLKIKKIKNKKCKFKINFKSNIYFFLPQKTRGPVNRSLGPTKSHTQIYYNFIRTWNPRRNVG